MPTIKTADGTEIFATLNDRRVLRLSRQSNDTWTQETVRTMSRTSFGPTIAPDGSAYVLQNRVGGSTDNIVKTFTVNLSSEVRNGTWTLRVQDAAAADVGTLNNWSLNL